jgi:hypothetical protein
MRALGFFTIPPPSSHAKESKLYVTVTYELVTKERNILINKRVPNLNKNDVNVERKEIDTITVSHNSHKSMRHVGAQEVDINKIRQSQTRGSLQMRRTSIDIGKVTDETDIN